MPEQEQKENIIDVESLLPAMDKRIKFMYERAASEKAAKKAEILKKQAEAYDEARNYLSENAHTFRNRNAFQFFNEELEFQKNLQDKLYEDGKMEELDKKSALIKILEMAKSLITFELSRVSQAEPASEQSAAQAKQQQEQLDSAQEQYEAKTKEQLRAARTKIETAGLNEQEKEILEEVIKQGGISMFCALPSEYAQGGYGFQTIHDKRVKDKRSVVRLEEKELMQDNGIDEHLLLAPEITYNQIVERVPQKGFLGRKKEPLKKYIQTQRETKLNELMANASDEPAYKLCYTALDGDRDGREYITEDGRPGGVFILKIALPKSLGLKIIEAVKDNPKFIRELADRLVTQQLNIPEKAWFKGDDKTNGHPLRPPYEAWSKKHESKIYIDGIGGANQRVFNPQYVHKVE